MEFAASISCPVLGWELTNEPNIMFFVHGLEGLIFPGTLAEDYATFSALVKGISTNYLVIGPDVAFQVKPH